jgi:zinc-binding alcohol dehydrogenase/oxidoreductase
MNGMMLWGPGQPLMMTEVPPVLPPVGDVFVRLKAAALNKRDYWITQGKYPGIVYPLIMGSDGAGILNEREVIINPGFNWGDKENYFSPGFKILGMPDNGTLSQLVEVPEQNIYDKPQHLNWHEAAALPVAGVTAYRAMFTRGHAKENERILITGIGGGVATMALLFARATGMEIWVTSGSDDKIEKAVSYGAKGGVNYSKNSWEKTLSEQAVEKFDLVIDGAGGSDFSKIITLLNPGARVVIYGGTAGNIMELSPQRIFWKQLNIIGSSMGSPTDFQGMLDFVNLHKIKPVISHTFPLEDANEAIAVVGRNEQFGKVCIDIT